MARGRMINQKITKDLDFNEMSIDAQFLFMRTIPYLDRDGLVTGHPALLWSAIAPLLPQYMTKIEIAINEWIEAGFAVKYMDKKTPVLFFKGFHKNQSLTHYDREAASEFAPPPGYVRTPKGIKPVDTNNDGETPQPPDAPQSNAADDVRQCSVNAPDLLRTYSGPTPDQIPVKGIEIEEKRNTTTRAREAEQAPEHSGESAGDGGGGHSITRNRQKDMEYAEICKRFESEGFGTLTPMLAEEINALMDEHPLTSILDAMSVAVQANKRQLRYVRGILVKWRADGKNTPAKPDTPKPKQLLTLKRWCLDKYFTDNPKFVPNVPENVIYAEYDQYRQQYYQQTH